MNINASYIVIDEATIKKAAEYCQDDELNSFRRIWKKGQEYKEAGLTPVYLLDQMLMQLVVVVAETFGKKLH